MKRCLLIRLFFMLTHLVIVIQNTHMGYIEDKKKRLTPSSGSGTRFFSSIK
ncbi:hypothetical protein [Paenibacillus humicola]|uniref:hypothetical protein n=1 Tax=Paenibacillus humicola TaxID=3110540 RepID=UPI00237A6637|nr:hypothetical protein [Paenibacillus humicola]